MEDLKKEAQRLRELFHGRFNQEEAEKLLSEFKSLQEAVAFVFKSEPTAVAEFLNRNGLIITKEESERANSELTELTSDLNSRKRLFACQTCERAWWKKVPFRKQVSRCHGCHVKYDPIPRNKEWGNGKFVCGHCQHKFETPATMGMTVSLCVRCNYPVTPLEIIPPIKAHRRRMGVIFYHRTYVGEVGEVVRPRITEHNCNGNNCFNCNGLANGSSVNEISNGRERRTDATKMEIRARIGITVKNEKPAVCIHKDSKNEMPTAVRVRTWSQPHVSTGSTVTTCLDQGDLHTDIVSLAYTMLTISSV